MTDSINVVSSDVEAANQNKAPLSNAPLSRYAAKKLAKLNPQPEAPETKGATVKTFRPRIQPQTFNTVRMYEVNGKILVEAQGKRQAIEVKGKLVSQTGKVDAFFLNTEAKALVQSTVDRAMRGKKFTILNGERSLQYKLIDLEKKDENPQPPTAA